MLIESFTLHEGKDTDWQKKKKVRTIVDVCLIVWSEFFWLLLSTMLPMPHIPTESENCLSRNMYSR